MCAKFTKIYKCALSSLIYHEQRNSTPLPNQMHRGFVHCTGWSSFTYTEMFASNFLGITYKLG